MRVSPPGGRLWRSNEAMTPRQVFARLINLGCHTTHITDAFYAADPFWVRHEGVDEPH